MSLEKVDSLENKMRKELLRQKEDLNYIIRTHNDEKLEYICLTMIDRIDNVLEEGVE